MEIATLIAGFAVLAWSADRFVLGASVAARRLGVPTLIVGLTIVGFGTSAPEITVSTIAAVQGNPGLALGNALGSNITNIGLILGATAVLYPLAVRSRLLRGELPQLIVVTLVMLLLLWDLRLSRTEGLLLLAGLAVFLGWLALQGRDLEAETGVISADFGAEVPAEMPLSRGLLWLVLGLALLLVSSQGLVWAAVGIAEALGVSDLVIGLTVVAFGTSLPELATCLASGRKGEYDIALGNIIGSNMFNTLGVIGVAASVTPFAVAPASLERDWPVMAAMTIALFLMGIGRGGEGRVNRAEGALLLLAWFGYEVYLIAGSLVFA